MDMAPFTYSFTPKAFFFPPPTAHLGVQTFSNMRVDTCVDRCVCNHASRPVLGLEPRICLSVMDSNAGMHMNVQYPVQMRATHGMRADRCVGVCMDMASFTPEGLLFSTVQRTSWCADIFEHACADLCVDMRVVYTRVDRCACR